MFRVSNSLIPHSMRLKPDSETRISIQLLMKKPLSFVFTSHEIIRFPMGTNDWLGWRR